MQAPSMAVQGPMACLVWGGRQPTARAQARMHAGKPARWARRVQASVPRRAHDEQARLPGCAHDVQGQAYGPWARARPRSGIVMPPMGLGQGTPVACQEPRPGIRKARPAGPSARPVLRLGSPLGPLGTPRASARQPLGDPRHAPCFGRAAPWEPLGMPRASARQPLGTPSAGC